LQAGGNRLSLIKRLRRTTMKNPIVGEKGIRVTATDKKG